MFLNLLYYAIKNGIGPVPTARRVRDLFLAEAKGKGPVVELGAGWGTLLVPLAKQRPDERVIGYENSWLPYFVLKLRRRPNMELYCQDFWKADLSASGLVVCYLYPAAMAKLRVKFEKELKPGTVVMSHTFAVPGWTPVSVLRANDLYRTPIYRYEIP